jgi:hypothetical protein
VIGVERCPCLTLSRASTISQQPIRQTVFTGRQALPSYLIHERPKLVNIPKAAVHAGKADVGDLVELFQLLHHQLAQAAGGDFAQAEVEQIFFDLLDRTVDLLGADRAFAQCRAPEILLLFKIMSDAGISTCGSFFTHFWALMAFQPGCSA